MHFKTKKIGKKTPRQFFKTFSKKEKVKFFTGGASLIIGFLLVLGLILFIKNFDISAIVFSFGKGLKTDRHGHTNIVLAGTGGGMHDGGDLTDTLMVASIDHENKKVSLLSIPRDLYVKSNKLNSGERINAIYFTAKKRFDSSKEALEEIKNVTSALVGMHIDYYIKVDFGGFRQIVDSIGGLDIIVEKDIYDPFYPLGESVHYQTFALKAGLQHLDGETALKYARSRKTSSDFDRSRRQHQLLAAIKEKTLSLNILTNPAKIMEIFNALKSSFETDLSLNEIITLAKISKEISKENIYSFVIGDNPNECGGFLYTPAREFFNGAYVLLPAGNNYDYIHLFTTSALQNPTLLNNKSAIQILNGTKKPNIAGEITNFLSRFCMNVIHYGNAEQRDLKETTIYYRAENDGKKPPILNFISKFLPFKTQAGIPAAYLNNEKKQQTVIAIELGEDYLQKRLQDPFQKLTLLAPAKPATTQAITEQN